MEQLIKELAKTLNIGNETIQSLIQNYPQIAIAQSIFLRYDLER